MCINGFCLIRLSQVLCIMTREMKKDSLAVVMITLNEAHNLERSIKNIKGWADEIFIVDSYSQDKTVDICLRHNISIIQKPF